MGRIYRLFATFFLLACHYADKAVAGLSGKVDEEIESSGYIRWLGMVDHYDDLPPEPKEGDCYTVHYADDANTVLDGTEYVWGGDGGGWVPFGAHNMSMHLDNSTLFVTVQPTDPVLSAMLDNQTFTLNY